MIKLVLAASLLANVLLGVAYTRTAEDYVHLLDWACRNGNGGHECGED